jgi:hypothetical protein
VTPLAVTLAATLDVAIAAGAAVLAALWLGVRSVRAWRGKSSGCGCAGSKATGCSAAEGMAKDLRAAAARGANRARGSVPTEPPRAPSR